MTCVIAVAGPDRVVMGADSCAGDLQSGEIYTVERPQKIIRRDPYLIGYTASYRLGQALSRAELPEPSPECDDPYEHMVDRFLPAVAHIIRHDREEIGDIFTMNSDSPCETRECRVIVQSCGLG